MRVVSRSAGLSALHRPVTLIALLPKRLAKLLWWGRWQTRYNVVFKVDGFPEAEAGKKWTTMMIPSVTCSCY